MIETINMVAGITLLACLPVIVLLFIPAIALRRSRVGMGVLFVVGAVSALMATAAFLVSHFTTPARASIRIDLLLGPLFLLFAWWQVVRLFRLWQQRWA